MSRNFKGENKCPKCYCKINFRKLKNVPFTGGVYKCPKCNTHLSSNELRYHKVDILPAEWACPVCNHRRRFWRDATIENHKYYAVECPDCHIQVRNPKIPFHMKHPNLLLTLKALIGMILAFVLSFFSEAISGDFGTNLIGIGIVITIIVIVFVSIKQSDPEMMGAAGMAILIFGIIGFFVGLIHPNMFWWKGTLLGMGSGLGFAAVNLFQNWWG